jgi:hypothetical protein
MPVRVHTLCDATNRLKMPTSYHKAFIDSRRMFNVLCFAHIYVSCQLNYVGKERTFSARKLFRSLNISHSELLSVCILAMRKRIFILVNCLMLCENLNATLKNLKFLHKTDKREPTILTLQIDSISLIFNER